MTETDDTTRTLRWAGEHAGRRAGDVLHLDRREWLVVVRAEPARTRRLTSADEDNGQGVAGDRVTTQVVHVRPATAEEQAAEEQRRADAAAAKRLATVDGQLAAWRAETGALGVSHERGEQLRRAAIEWEQEPRAIDRTRSGATHASVRMGRLPGGAAVAVVTRYDSPDVYYEVVAADEQARREAEAAAKRRRDTYAYAAEAGLAHVRGLTYLSGYDLPALDAPETDEERAQIEAGRAVDADRARVRELLDAIHDEGVVDPSAAAEVVAILERHPDAEGRGFHGWDEVCGGNGRPTPPDRRHLLRYVRAAAETGRRVAWAPAHALGQLTESARYPRWSPVAQHLAARGLRWAEQYSAPRAESAEVLDELDRWCDDLDAPRLAEAAEIRVAVRERRLAAVRRTIEDLSDAQRAIVDGAKSDDARRLGLLVMGAKKRSAAKLVELGLATIDEAGRLWLTQDAQAALGLPRLESDERMRARERDERREAGL